ncbi:2-C-methyl-D-erythritol 4-phosphate cytidylyltransferase [Tessaracoccus aquimaris]|uniref:2-C-methyl-D-erythritol 4-phosphate cytidylyltransferase n=1 Tax=Tessaracoccus aquimaris TaxID=1332264 RepID=A0A1Q2CPP2_9ACTN|nr:2-C-methyl-D-erythritol 4-phosphate cytidylyltransferase [Tessaracoccus aquimaris]AQP48073.1 2-C-methyl-D-erythritol 4-phosphate cytidylyltransferase [Tessaracoccus aquimaris]
MTLSNKEPVVAVVVAAGSGSRLGADLPKALVPLEGVALVRRAVDALLAAGVGQVVVTIPPDHESGFAAALNGTGARLVPGGADRQDSVRLGLLGLDAPDDAVALVHDAARALVPTDVVRRVADAVLGGAEVVIPVVPVVDSIRRVDPDGSAIVDRSLLRAVQTPQAARLGALRSAHERVLADGVEVTDDAAVCEHVGMRVSLVDGHRDAMKVTEPVDLILAKALLAERSPADARRHRD